MPVTLNVPAPRNTYIGTVDAKGRVPIDRDWLVYFTRTLVDVLGGIGPVDSLPELSALIEQASDAAAAAQETADAAAADAELGKFAASRRTVMPARLSVRAGSGVTVARDARGYVVSASGGLPVDDENTVIAGRFFGA